MEHLRHILLLILLLLGARCKENNINKNTDGKKLAQVNCAACHTFPSPELLDKITWKNRILPVMGMKLGFNEPTKEAETNMTRLLLEGGYSSVPVITSKDWKKIKSYYLNKAPNKLDNSKRPDTIETTSLFKPKALNLNPSFTPGITALKIDTAYQRIWAADGTLRQLFNISSRGAVKSFRIDYTVSSIDVFKQKDKILLTHIGQSLQPTENKDGMISSIALDHQVPSKSQQHVLADNLGRPVETLVADFTGDGREEMLVAEFGFRTGALSYLKEKEDGTLSKIILKNEPGAIKSIPLDMNKDGRMDVVTLFAQAKEKIVLFRNKGNEHFEEIPLLTFPPSYGSTHFEMKDFNSDGLLDILYTCGDNADYSPVLKPYHGIYLFLNKGDLTFEQRYFYPMHGAYKAMAKDYDMDGDLDIAAIAFFADYDNFPENSFVYLEHDGGLGFTPKTLPIHTLGRWITMDAGDYDGDGDEDLVLGNNLSWPGTEHKIKEWGNSSEVYILENQKIAGTEN